MKVRLNKRAVDSLLPQAKRYEVQDDLTPGLRVVVYPTGAKTFIRYGRIDGKPVRYKIGPFPAITVQAARDKCNQLTGAISAGENPHQERLSRRAGRTLADCWEDFQANHAIHRKTGRPLAPKTMKDYGRQWELYFDDLRWRKVETITPDDVADWHDRIGLTKGHVTANRALALLSTICTKTRVRPNPATGVDKFPEHSRERRLTEAEAHRIAKALDSMTELFQDFVLLALYTGQRRANVLAMKWTDINLQGKVWTISAEEMKSRQAVAIHLSTEALAILKRRQESAKGPYVLPGRKPRSHYVEVYRSWRKLLELADIDDLTPHDLRRTLASVQADNHSSLLVISKSLGQSTTYSTTTYTRVAEDPVRKSVNKASRQLAAMMKGTK